MKKTILTIMTATFALTPAVWAAPAMQDVIVPQHIQGINGTNAKRVPYAFRVKFTGLTASATYRFLNQVVLSTESTTVNGAGNVIYAATSGNFYGSTSPGMSTAGAYGEFTADASGEASVWMITEPTGNSARFMPGNTVYMRIRLNDGAGGTTVANYLTTTGGAVVQDLTTASSGYTGIRGNSQASAKDFVFLYDNEAGTGRPLSGTLLESDGYAVATSYAAFYRDNVDGVDKAWGAIIPNSNASGVRRIERRALLNGNVFAQNTDSDGVWPSGANTVNPLGGGTAVVITDTDAPLVPEPATCMLGGLLVLAALRRR
jgi:hypothetical protein